jgi:amidase
MSVNELPPEPWKWDAVDAARALAGREISARELLAACLERLDTVNPQVNAVVRVDREGAAAAAAAADEAMARGETTGFLHGLPLTTKSVSDVEGMPTDVGVEAFAGNIAKEDGAPARNLRNAGAVLMGRTNVPCMSLRWCTQNALHGRTLNPWAPALTPGGSSGGAAVALAVGIGPLAHGTDGGGSIRYPAACSGVVGLRPSHGRVPGFNPSAAAEAAFGGQFMVAHGPMARRVRDVRLMLQAMSEPDRRDPWWMPVPLAGPPPARPIRVAMHTDPTGFGVDAGFAEAVLRAGRALEAAGYVVEEVNFPDFAATSESWFDIAADQRDHLSAIFERVADPDTLRAHHLVATGRRKFDPGRFRAALAERTARARSWARFTDRYPIVLGPSANAPPFPYGLDVAGEAEADEMFRIIAPMLLAPVLGVPAVSLPVGLAGGVPVSVQIHGPRFREDLVLDAAEAIESACAMPTPTDPLPSGAARQAGAVRQ